MTVRRLAYRENSEGGFLDARPDGELVSYHDYADALGLLTRIREAAGPVRMGVTEWDHITGDIAVTVPISHLRALLRAIGEAT